MKYANETARSKAIRDALERIGCWVERVNSGQVKVRGGWMHLASNGTPDTLVIAPVFGWLETKTDTTDLNDDQRKWHARARRFRIRVATVREPRDAIDVVQGWIRERTAA